MHSDPCFRLFPDPCFRQTPVSGIARDPEQRYAQHSAGKGARFTRANPPRALLGWVWVDSRRAALKLEIAWKRLPRAERIAALRAIPKTGQSQKKGATSV